MQLRHGLIALISGVFLFGAQSGASLQPAGAQSVEIGERCRIDSEGSEALCDLRPSSFVEIDGVDLEDADGRGVDGANFSRFKTDAPTSILFVIDVSDPRRQNTVDQIKGFILNQIERVDDANDDHVKFAVATFAEEFVLVGSFDDSMRDVERATSEIIADGRRTELKNAMNEAVAVLQESDEGIRIMVVMTDGIDENPDRISDNNLIQKLDEAGVTVFAMGYPERSNTRAQLRNISLYSDATAGVFVEATIRDKTLPEDFVENFVALTSNGGFLRFPLPEGSTRPRFNLAVDLADTDDDPELRLTVNTNEAATFEESSVSAIVGSSGSSNRSDDGDDSGGDGTLDKILEQIEDLVPGVDPKLVLGIGGGLLALILLFLLSGLFRKGKKRAPTPSAATPPPVPPMSPPPPGPDLSEIGATAVVSGPPGSSSPGSMGTMGASPPPPSNGQPDRLRQAGGSGIRTPMEPEPLPDPLPSTSDATAGRTIATLHVVGGSGQAYPLTQKAVKIGRGSDNDVILSDTTVHRQHAVLHLQDDSTFVITDLNTKNGVLINGVLKDQSALKDGDIIELGEVRLRFEYTQKA